MGLITGLLTLPLAPVRGLAWLAEQLEREAYRQWTDPAAIRERLVEIDAAYEAGGLTSAERDALQNDLVARLMAGSAGAP